MNKIIMMMTEKTELKLGLISSLDQSQRLQLSLYEETPVPHTTVTIIILILKHVSSNNSLS